FYIWARIGVRAPGQLGWAADFTADRNVQYFQTGVRYRTNEEIAACANLYFSRIEFPQKKFYSEVGALTQFQRRIAALRGGTVLATLATIPLQEVLLTADKRL